MDNFAQLYSTWTDPDITDSMRKMKRAREELGKDIKRSRKENLSSIGIPDDKLKRAVRRGGGGEMKVFDELIGQCDGASGIRKAVLFDELEQSLDRQLRELHKKKLAFAEGGATVWREFSVDRIFDEKKQADKQQLEKDKLYDRGIQQENATMAWFYRSALEEMGELRISGRDEFVEARRLALQEGDSKKEIQALYSAAEKFEHQSQQAQSRAEKARDRAKGAQDHSNDVQGLNTKQGWNLVERLKVDSIKFGTYSKEASQRAEELKTILEDVKAHQQATEKIIGVQISKAQQRSVEDKKRFEAAEERYSKAKEYKEVKHSERLKKLEADKKETDIGKIDQKKMSRIAEAERQAKLAEERVKQADKRAEAAENQVKREKACGLDGTAAENAAKAAKDAATHARTIAELEKGIADSLYAGNIALEEKKLLKIQEAAGHEAKALEREKDAVYKQQEETEKGRQALEQLIGNLQDLEAKLEKSKKYEENFEKDIKGFFGENRIKLKIKDKNAIVAQKKQVLDHSKSVIDAENDIKDAFFKMKDLEEKAAKALQYNAIHMEQEETAPGSQAIKRLEAIPESLTEKDIQMRIDGTQAYWPIDRPAGRTTVSGHWLEIKKMSKITWIDDHTIHVEWRPDIADIRLVRQTRDAGKIDQEQWDTKRLGEGTVRIGDWEITLDIPDNVFSIKDDDGNTIGRRKATLTMVNTKTNERSVQDLEMETVKSIHIIENLVNEKMPESLGVRCETQVMPPSIVDIRQALNVHDGCTPDKVRKMAHFHFDPKERKTWIILPEGLGKGKRISIDTKDLTDTIWESKELGLVMRDKGLPENAMINLNMASSNLLDKAKMDAEKELQGMAKTYLDNSIKLLKRAIATGNKKIIAEAFRCVEKNDAQIASVTAILRRDFDSPPQNKEELDSIRAKRSKKNNLGNRLETLLGRLEEEYKKSAGAMEGERKNLDSDMKKRIRAIHQSDSFLASVKQFSEALKRTSTENTSTEKKKNLWDEIKAAEHLDETFEFELLTNPNLAATFIAGIAEDAGKAARIIEEINGKNTKEAIEAQNQVEKEIFTDVNDALSTYRTDKKRNLEDNDSGYNVALDQDKSLEDFHAALRRAIHRATILQAKADVLKTAQDFAKITSESPGAQEAKNAFVQKEVFDRAEKLEEDMIKEQIAYAQKEIKQRLDLSRKLITVNRGGGPPVQEEARYLPEEIKAEQEKVAVALRKDAETARDQERTNGRPKDEQHRAGAVAAARTAFRLAKGYADAATLAAEAADNTNPQRAQAARNAQNDINTAGNNAANTVRDKFNAEIQNTGNDAEKRWKEGNIHENFLAREILEKLDTEVENIKKEAIAAGENAEDAGGKAALRFATIETEKLEVARAQFAASRAQGKNVRDAQRDAYNEAKDLELRANSFQAIDEKRPPCTKAQFTLDPRMGPLTPAGRDHTDLNVPVNFCIQDISRITITEGGGWLGGFFGGQNFDTLHFKRPLPNTQPGQRAWAGWRQPKDIPAVNTTHNKWKTLPCMDMEKIYLPNGRGEIPLKYIAWDKTEQSNEYGVTLTLRDAADVPADLRGRKINLLEACSNKTFAERKEVAVLAVMQEATKKRLWAQAVKVVADSRRVISDAQGKDKIQQGADVAAYITDLRTFADDAANKTKGDSAAKNAAWLGAVQRYAVALEKIAGLVTKAADAREASAKHLGENAALEARHKSAQLVIGFVDLIGRKTSAGVGKGSLEAFEAATTIAEHVAATEVTLAKNAEKASNSAKTAAQLLDTDQEKAVHRIAQSLEGGMIAAGATARTASVEASRAAIEKAARKHAGLTGDNPVNTVRVALNFLNTRTAEVDHDITPDRIADKNIRNTVKDTIKVIVAAQWAMIEESILDVANTKRNIAVLNGITAEAQLQAEARNGVGEVFDCVTNAIRGKETVEAGAAAVVAVKEYALLLQAKEKAAKAEKAIARRTTAGNQAAKDAAQTNAVHRVLGGGLGGIPVGTIDAIYNQGGLVAVIQHAESRAQVAEAVVEAEETAREAAPPAQADAQALAAAQAVDTAAQTALTQHVGNPIAQSIEAAVAAKKAAASRKGDLASEAAARNAKAAVTDAANQVQTIRYLAEANHKVVEHMTAHDVAVERFVATGAEMVDLAKEAAEIVQATAAPTDRYEAGHKATQRVFKASKESAMLFEARAKVAKYARDIQGAMGVVNPAQIKDALQTVNTKFEQGGLIDAIRYTASLAQVAKAVTEVPTAQNATIIYNAFQAARTEHAGDPIAQDREAASVAARRAATFNGGDAELAVRNARKAVTDAVDDAETTIVYYGDTYETYKSALKGARETLVAEKIGVTKDGESVKQASARAFDGVKESASKVSRDFMQRIENVRDIALRHEGNLTEVYMLTASRTALDFFTLQARINVENAAKKIAEITNEDMNEDASRQDIAAQNAIRTLETIAHNARRKVWIQGGDKIAQEVAVAVAITAYASTQAEIARDAEAAARDAGDAATLAGVDDAAAMRAIKVIAAKDVIIVANNGRYTTVLEDKDEVEQHAAAAAAAARCAANYAEVKQSAEAVARSARDLARERGLNPTELPGLDSQETEAQKAAGDVIPAFERARMRAARAKVAQAELDTVNFAREIAEASGKPAYTDRLLGFVRQAAQLAQDDGLRRGLSPAAREEAIAQAAAARATSIRSLRDLARAAQATLEAEGVVGNPQRARVSEIIADAVTLGNEILGGARNAGKDVVEQNVVAAEIVTHLATQWRAVESAARAASAVETALGNAGGRQNAARRIRRSIRAVIRGTIEGETQEIRDAATGQIIRQVGTDKLTAYKLAAEVATQLATVQNARLTAALSARESTRIANTHLAPAMLAGQMDLGAQRAVTGVDNTIANNRIEPFLPLIDDIPRQYNREAMRAPIKARLALRATTAEAKVTQALEASVPIVEDTVRRAFDPADPNSAALVRAAQQLWLGNIYNTAAAARGAGGADPAVDAAIAAKREHEALVQIAEAVKNAEMYAGKTARLANFAANRIVAAKLQAANQALIAVNNVIGAGGANKTLNAIMVAKENEGFQAQMAKAVERLAAHHQANPGQFQADTANLFAFINLGATPINRARNAAEGTDNLINGAAVGATRPAGVNKANEAEQAMQDVAAEALDKLNGTAAIAQNAEIVRMLDDVEAVTRNADVLQAMDEAARSGAHAEKIAGGDELAQATVANQAIQTVIRAAITGRSAAASLDENIQRSEEAKAANSVAARFLSRYAVAVSTKEISIGKMGDPAVMLADAQLADQAGQAIVATHGGLMHAPQAQINLFNQHRARRNALRAQAPVVEAAIQAEVRIAINDLDTTLSQETKRMAGLVFVNGAFTVTDGDTPINKANAAIREYLHALGENDAKQMTAVKGFEKNLTTKATKAKKAVEDAGGDEVEGNRDAAAMVERLVEIELAKRDAVLAAQETAELTDGKTKEAVERVIQTFEEALKATEGAAKAEGMGEYAQIAAVAAEARKLAEKEKRTRDVIKTIKDSAARAGVDKDTQDTIAKGTLNYTKDSIETAKKTAAKEAAPSILAGLIEKSLKTMQKEIEDAFPVPVGAGAGVPLVERNACMIRSKENLLTIVQKVRNTNIQLNNDIGIEALEEAVAINQTISLQKSIIKVQMDKIADLQPQAPGPGANPAIPTPAEQTAINAYNLLVHQTLEKAEKDVLAVANHEQQKAADSGQGIIAQYAASAAAAQKFVIVEQAVRDAQAAALVALGARPQVGMALTQALLGNPIGTVATQNHVDTYDLQVKDAKNRAEANVRNAANNAAATAAAEGKGLTEQHTAAAAVAAKEACRLGNPPGNADAQAIAASKARETVKAAADGIQKSATGMQATVRNAENTFAAAVSAAIFVRMSEVERAMRGLSTEDAVKVKNAANRAEAQAAEDGKDLVGQHAAAAAVSAAISVRMSEVERAIRDLSTEDAVKVKNAANRAEAQAAEQGKSLIEQHAAAAAAAARKACELAGRKADARAAASKAKGAVKAAASKARRAVKAAAAATHVDAVKASGGTAIQTAIAHKFARYATAQAKIAHAIDIVAPHARTRAAQLTALGHVPTSTPDTATQVVAKTMKDLIAAELLDNAGNPDANKDPIEALEKGADTATEYVTQIVGAGALTIPQNLTTATEAKGFAALAEQYASKGAGRDMAIEGAVATDVAHILNVSKTAGIKIAGDIAAQSFVEIAKSTPKSIVELQRDIEKSREELQETAIAAENASKAKNENESQQSKIALEAAIKAVTAKDATARNIANVAKIVKAGAQATDLNADQITSEITREVRDTAIAEQDQALRDAINNAITDAVTMVENDAGPFAIALAGLPTPTTPQELAAQARHHIEAAAKEAQQAAALAKKDLITQRLEAVAAATAQGVIESAKIVILESMDSALVGAGMPPGPVSREQRKRALIGSLDSIVQIAKTNAGLDIIEQYIAAAKAAKQAALIRETIYQSIINVTTARNQATARGTYVTAIQKAQIVDALSGRVNAIEQEWAIMNFITREASRVLGGDAGTQTGIAQLAFWTVVKAGDAAAQSVRGAVDQAQSGADEAYRDGAKRQAEVGIALGQALEAVAPPLKEAASAIAGENLTEEDLTNYQKVYAKFFTDLLIALDKEAENIAVKNGKNLKKRTQDRMKVINQAVSVIAKVAEATKCTANAQRVHASITGQDANEAAQQGSKRVFDAFIEKRAAIKAGGGNLTVELAAGGEAAAQIAEAAVILKGEIKVLTEQIHRSLGRTIVAKEQKEQITKEAVKYVLNQVNDARAATKTANRDFNVQEQAVVIREASLKARTDAISSVEKIDETVTKVALEMDAAFSAGVKLSELNGVQLIEAYDKYVGSDDPAEKAERQRIADFIDDETKGVHYYYRNQLNLRRALAAALRGNYYGQEVNGVKIPGAYYYLHPDRLKTETEVHTTEQGKARQDLEHRIVGAIRHALDAPRREGMNDDLMLPILMKAMHELAVRSKNVELAEVALDPESPISKAKESLEDMVIAEVKPPKLITEGDEEVELDKKGRPKKPKKPKPRKKTDPDSYDSYFKAMNTKSRQEMIELSQEIHDAMEEAAKESYERELESLDSEQRALFITKRAEWIKDKRKELVDQFNRNENMAHQLYKMRWFRREMNKQRWKDLLKEWFFLWLKSGVEGASKGQKDMMGEIEKLAMKLIGGG